MLRGQDLGNKRSQRPPPPTPASREAADHPRPPWKCSRWTAPSPTSDPLPGRLDGCPSGRGSSRRGKATGAPFPRPPSRLRARRAPPKAPRLGPPAWRGGARSLGGEQGRRPRGRSRRTAAGRGEARRGGRDDGRGPIGSPEGRGGVAAASLGLVAPRDPPGAIGRARVLRLSIADSGLRS